MLNSKDLKSQLLEHRAALVAEVKKIDAVLGLFGIGVATAGKGKKGVAASNSDRAKKAWATKKRKAAEAAKAAEAGQANGASLLEAVS